MDSATALDQTTRRNKMTTYTIAELQNAQSSRKGETVQAANLTAAKRKASTLQMFQGTVMEIAAENGSFLSRKQDGKWIDSL
jgi:ribosomal protein L19